MYINFNFHGSLHKADLARQGENKILVLLNDDELEKQFGSPFIFNVENNSVSFNNPNRSHSELFALSSTISNAIKEQCKEVLKNS